MIGSINLLAYTYNDYLVKPNWNRCSVFKNIESYVVTWATMSSYVWTIILSFYKYLSIAYVPLPCFGLGGTNPGCGTITIL